MFVNYPKEQIRREYYNKWVYKYTENSRSSIIVLEKLRYSVLKCNFEKLHGNLKKTTKGIRESNQKI